MVGFEDLFEVKEESLYHAHCITEVKVYQMGRTLFEKYLNENYKFKKILGIVAHNKLQFWEGQK